MRNKRKAQSWYIDFVIGAVLFTGAFFLMLKYMPSTDNSLIDATLDGEILSDVMISEGIPVDWTNETVVKLGLLSDGKIDEDKWMNLTSLSYERMKYLIPVSADFVIYFAYPNGSKIDVGNRGVYAGMPGANETNIKELFDPESIVSLDRLAAYNGEIVIMNVIVWS